MLKMKNNTKKKVSAKPASKPTVGPVGQNLKNNNKEPPRKTEAPVVVKKESQPKKEELRPPPPKTNLVVGKKHFGLPQLTGEFAKTVGKLDSGSTYKDYDNFRESINPYLQTLLDPYNCTGVRIPFGDIMSTVFQIRVRWLFETDAQGNMFVALGQSRSIEETSTPGIEAASYGNACSFIPNTLRTKTRFAWPSVGDSDFDWHVGTWTGNGTGDGTGVDLTDLFKVTHNTGPDNDVVAFNNLQLPNWDSSSQTVPNTFAQARLVSAGVVATPVGTLVQSKGMMILNYIPADQYGSGEDAKSFDGISQNDMLAAPYSCVIPMNKVESGSILYRPIDYGEFNYVNLGTSAEHNDVQVTDETSPGGFWILLSGCEANMTVVVDAVFNYEAIAQNNTFMPGAAAPCADDMAIEHAEEVLSRTPSCFIGSRMVDKSYSGQFQPQTTVNGVRMEHAFRHTEGVALHANPTDHTFQVPSSSMKGKIQLTTIHGPQPIKGMRGFWGGLKKGLAWIGDKTRPMIDRMFSEFVPQLAEKAVAAAIKAI